MILGSRLQLKGWQQAAVALGSAVGALLDPRKEDLIAALRETTGKPAFDRVLERMKMSTRADSWKLKELAYAAMRAREVHDFWPSNKPDWRNRAKGDGA